MADEDVKLLFVDDEPNVLEGLRRTLVGHFEIVTATSGEEALQRLGSEGPFAVIVSDMRMPGMDGSTVLSHACVKSPDTTRMLLTGYSEINDAIAAVNEGQIYRFLTKPCSKDAILRALRDGIAQHRLVLAERELLEETLSGAVDVLVEVLNLTAPSAFSHSGELKRAVQHMAKVADLPDSWRVELAAQLSQLGCVAVPPEIVVKAQRGEPLTDEERGIYESHPETGFRLLSRIPRLEPVAQMVRVQLSQTPINIDDDEVRLGAEMLRIAQALRSEMQKGSSKANATSKLKQETRFPKQLLQSLDKLEFSGPPRIIKMLTLKQLRSGMVLEEPVMTPNGGVIVPKAREVTVALLDRLKNFARGRGVVEPIKVSVEG